MEHAAIISTQLKLNVLAGNDYYYFSSSLPGVVLQEVRTCPVFSVIAKCPSVDMQVKYCLMETLILCKGRQDFPLGFICLVPAASVIMAAICVDSVQIPEQ